MFGKDHFGNLGDIEDPMEEDIDVPKGRQTHKKRNFDEEFGRPSIID